VDLGQLDKKYFSNIFGLSFKLSDFDTFEWNRIQNLNHEDFRNRAFRSFYSKYGFESKSSLNLILKPWIFFQKGKLMILERLRQSFGFEIESNTGSNESGCFLLAL
jgi:hypothetical protein